MRYGGSIFRTYSRLKRHRHLLILPVIVLGLYLATVTRIEVSTKTVKAEKALPYNDETELISKKDYIHKEYYSSRTYSMQKQQHTMIDEIMQNRRQTLNDKCKKKQVRGQIQKSMVRYLEFDSKHKIAHCLVAKVGSTFWGRIFYALNRGQIKSPYDVPLTGERKSGEDFRNVKLAKVRVVLEKSTNFLVTRNPFSRVLSAYIDKLFSPNPYYWNAWGKIIVSRRSGHTSVKCRHDIAFEEFVDHVYIAQKFKKHKDQHFTPVSDQCNPCWIKYDYIGKLETFSQDTYYILDKLNLTDYIEVLMNDSNKRAVDDAICDTATGFIDWRQDVKKCMSLDEAFQRLWRRMQIRGYISFNVEYPLSRENLENVDKEKLIHIMQKASRKSFEQFDMKKEKQKTLTWAYNSVPTASIKRLTEAYKDDFENFGYDIRPSYLFNKTSEYMHDIFDWRNKII